MQKCYERYLLPSLQSGQDEVVVVDVGSADVNGGYRTVLADSRIRYLGVDLAPGPGVDVVARSPYELPFGDAHADFVLSGQMLEHSEFFWLVFQEMLRILKSDGYLFLIAPSAGPIHRFPVDCYRFYPDAFHALARFTGCSVIDIWHDERGPWRDVVGIFSKQPKPRWSCPARRITSREELKAIRGREEEAIKPRLYADRPDIDRVSGTVPYLELLGTIHQELSPRSYLEIGVAKGKSLRLAKCPSIGVDPAPSLDEEALKHAQIYAITSDDFFEFEAARLLARGIDLAFIDGMHHFEYVLRDFINLERYSTPETLLVVDDIFPNHPVQGLRVRESRIWTGDVWKLYGCLKKHRSDLILMPVNTSQAGSLLIANLDCANRTLVERYNSIVREFVPGTPSSPPTEVLARHDVIEPHDPRILDLLRLLHGLREGHSDMQLTRQQLLEFLKKLHK